MTRPMPEGEELPDTHLRHREPQRGSWLVTLSWRVIDGVPECVGIAFTPEELTGPITESVIRRAGLAKKIAAERTRLLGGTSRPLPPTGMRRSTYEQLQRVAEAYRAAVAGGSQPVQAVQRAIGTTPGYAANLVSRARAVGLLPPTSAGVALGEVEKPISGAGGDSDVGLVR